MWANGFGWMSSHDDGSGTLTEDIFL